MKIVITGITGLIGRPLSESLIKEGHTVTGLSRSPERVSNLAADLHKWEPQAEPPPAEALKNADVVVHLAGEPVAARRWSDEQKRRISDSRIISTRNLVAGFRSTSAAPPVFVSGSAVGFYGNRGDEQLDESAPAGRGFLSDVCKQWEAEALAASDLGVRVVVVRTGVVLSKEGGALKKMLPAFKLGAGGRLASGRQWFPWIHIDDIVGIFRHAILSLSMSGPVNGTAPEVVTNSEFTTEISAALGRPAFFPVPEFALRLLMGEMADVLLASQRVTAKAALADGFRFRYPSLKQALGNLLSNSVAA